MNIGIFGGAFDPPHNAHVALACAAVEQLKLDKLHIVPTGQALHKTRPLSAPTHRLAMAELAFADVPGAMVDAQEFNRAGPSYTIDTLEAIKIQNPASQLFLIIGGDQAASFDAWHRWPDILQNAIIYVAKRPLESGSMALKQAQTLNFELSAVSSTQIRRHVACNQSIEKLVPPAVARYISEHFLYSKTP